MVVSLNYFIEILQMFEFLGFNITDLNLDLPILLILTILATKYRLFIDFFMFKKMPNTKHLYDGKLIR